MGLIDSKAGKLNEYLLLGTCGLTCEEKLAGWNTEGICKREIESKIRFVKIGPDRLEPKKAKLE